MRYVPISTRLENNSIPEPNTGCLLWMASTNRFGYGHIGVGRKIRNTHRVAWEQAYGPIPDGLCVLHRCDVRSCINPNHLFLGTYKDNGADMAAKGRAPRGERSGLSKLTEEEVRDIRASTDAAKVLARKYNVGHWYISQIRRKVRWAHIQ